MDLAEYFDCDHLTHMEQLVMDLYAAGQKRAEIARELKRSPTTISHCLAAVKEKYHARTLQAAAAIHRARNHRLP